MPGVLIHLAWHRLAEYVGTEIDGTYCATSYSFNRPRPMSGNSGSGPRLHELRIHSKMFGKVCLRAEYRYCFV